MYTPVPAKAESASPVVRWKSWPAFRNPAKLALDVLFVLTIGAQLFPVWFWTYFPSLDGPSHLYNASILLNYSKVPLYQQYYRITYDTPGNVLTQLVLSSLLTVFTPLVAEKVFLSLYLVSFPLAFRQLIRALGGDAPSFSFFAIVASYNHFLHLGFWNFCAAIPLALSTLACVIKGKAQTLKGGRFAALLLLALATYLCHPVAWAMTVLAAAWLLAWELSVPPVRAGSSLWSLCERLLTMSAVVLPGILYLLSTRVPGRLAFPRFSLSRAARSLYQLGFLNSYGETDRSLRGALLVSVAALIVFGALTCGIRRLLNPMLGLSLICVPLVAFGPDGFGTLSLIRDRVGIFAFLFLCAGLATIESPKKVAPAILAVFLSALSIAGIWRREPIYKYWNARLAEYAAIASRIEANSIVLSLNRLEPETHSIPTKHAVGNWTPKPFIDLTNFEARDVIFPVRFRNMLSPQMNVWAPLNVYLDRLSSEHFQLDYILFNAEPAQLMRAEELEKSSGILKQFTLDYASPEGHLRLYRRNKFVPGE